MESLRWNVRILKSLSLSLFLSLPEWLNVHLNKIWLGEEWALWGRQKPFICRYVRANKSSFLLAVGHKTIHHSQVAIIIPFPFRLLLILSAMFFLNYFSLLIACFLYCCQASVHLPLNLLLPLSIILLPPSISSYCIFPTNNMEWNKKKVQSCNFLPRGR